MSEDNYMSAENSKSAEAFVEGLSLIAKHWPEGMKNSYFMGGEHDIIYIYDSDEITEESEEGQRLRALGFHYADEGWAWFT